MLRSVLCALWVVVCAGLAGCGGDGKSRVKGTLTFDGQPVTKGSITFVRSEGTLVREGALINDGKFEAAMPPGKYRIEVNSQKVVGKRKQKGFSGAEEEVEITEELFPEWYNTKSTLTADIKTGTDVLTLDLKSKK